MLRKIISGGQTGIDKMGVTIAFTNGFETGGTAPKDFMTENGTDYTLKAYGLKEISEEDQKHFEEITGKTDRFTARTYVNTRDSDGTVYLSTDKNSPGAKTTRNGCEYHSKPFIMNPNFDSLCQFIDDYEIETLNVAGNRASKLSAADSKRFYNLLDAVLKYYKELKEKEEK